MISHEKDGLPPYLQKSIDGWLAGQDKLARGEEYLHWDCDYCDLQASINAAEAEQSITPNFAWALRDKYLGLSKAENSGIPAALTPTQVEISFSLEKEIYDQFEQVCARYGLTAEEALIQFVRKTVELKHFPFDLE